MSGGDAPSSLSTGGGGGGGGGGQASQFGSQPTTTTKKKQGKFIPQPSILLFETGNVVGSIQKIDEYSEQEGVPAIFDKNKKLLSGLLTLLRDTSQYHIKFVPDYYQLIVSLLSWPAQYLLPVLDVLRQLFLHPNSAEVLSIPPQTFPGKHVDILQYIIDILTSKQPQNPWNVSRALCVITNMFYTPHARKLLETRWESVLQGVAESAHVDSSTALTAATVLINYGVCAQLGETKEVKAQSLLILTELLKTISTKPDDQPELLVRVLVAIGTLLWNDTRWIQSEISKDIKSLLVAIPQSTDASVNGSLTELLQLIS